MFHRLSKQLEFCQKYSAARRIFNSLLGVWISQLGPLCLVFDILLRYRKAISYFSVSKINFPYLLRTLPFLFKRSSYVSNRFVHQVHHSGIASPIFVFYKAVLVQVFLRSLYWVMNILKCHVQKQWRSGVVL